MGKYINVPQSILGDLTATNPVALYASTLGTDGATEGKVTDSVALFETTNAVSVGDIVVITTAVAGYAVRSWATITAVDSETVLSVVGIGLPATSTGGLSASGTIFSVIAAADAYKCVVAAKDFPSVLQAGDWVLNTGTNLIYQVTSVPEDTVIMLNVPGGVLTGNTVVVLSSVGVGSVSVRVDNTTVIRGNVANGQLTLHYKRGATNQKLTIDPNDATITSDAFAIEFMRLAERAMKSQWTNVALQMPLIAGGADGVLYAGTLTWA